jgi:hypothetical protein
MPSYKLIFYVLFCVFIGLTITMQLMKSQRPISGILYLILAILIFVFFGLRWFGASGAGRAVQWPPIINSCPDYLTKYERTKNGVKTQTCIDLVGVSKNCALKKWPSDGSTPSNDAFYFTLDGKTMETKCADAKAAGLTWEMCDIYTPGGGAAPDGPSGSKCTP